MQCNRCEEAFADDDLVDGMCFSCYMRQDYGELVIADSEPDDTPLVVAASDGEGWVDA